jgi:hypothetical protein
MPEERKDKETEMSVNTVHVPMVEPQKVEATEVDTEVHIQKVELPPVEVTFREPPKITIRLNDKIPDLNPKDKTE